MLSWIHEHVAPDRRFRLNRILVDTPGLGEPYLALRSSMRPLRVTKESDVVLDGFPRSANTYALMAFRLATGGQVRVSGHTHASRTIAAGAKRRLPVILIVRDPADAVASLVQAVPGIRPITGFKAYSRFHERVLRFAERILVVPFDLVVSDFGKVMEAANARFGASFEPYVKSEDNEGIVAELIDEANRSRSGSLLEHEVSRPSLARLARTGVLGDLDGPTKVAWETAQRSFDSFNPYNIL